MEKSNLKATLGNLLFYACVFTIILSYYFGNHSLLSITWGIFGGYMWRVLGETLEESQNKERGL